MSDYRLTTEVFSLPHDEGHLVYAPLMQTSDVVNDAARNVLADIAADRAVPRDAATGAVLDLLERLDLITTGAGAASDPQAPVAVDGSATVEPTAVTLFLTTACNLRCAYCYASGGDDVRTLDPEVARDAVDLVVANVVKQGDGNVRLSFHGGGEPTLAFDTLRRSVEHARARCDEHGLQLSVGTATNGVMDGDVLEYVAETMTSVTVSLDGPPEVQDALRPRPGGGPSSDAVLRTLERLARSDVSVSVRMTCTAEAMRHAPGTVADLAERFGVGTVHLEPLFVCGRSIGNGLRPPSPDEFVESFRACLDVGRRVGIKVAYSGARHESLTCSFCQASVPSFNVTTEGDVTACYEVVGRDDARAGTFIYGSHDPATRSFVFDPVRVARLRRLTVHSAPRCARCFAKYHCAGDCAAKRLYPGAGAAVAARCEMNRRLTLDQLEEVFRCQTTSPAPA